jgi:arylsulfatase A-like enzyme
MARLPSTVLLLAVIFFAGVTPVFADRPNIIVILADDLGYGDLGCYGHRSFETPRIDRMAAEGVRFTDFYVPTPYCAPTRAALLTGRYPFRSGMVFNPAPDNGIDDVGLPDSELTLAEALRKAGYATTCIGKWHLGHRPRFFPTRHGFDSYYGILYSNDMRPVQLIENESVVEYPVFQATLTQRYTQRALDFIETNRDRPFFLYLPHAMPHKPLAASEAFYKTSSTLYGDVMAELDWSVGQILDKLRDLKLDETTLVIFTSDNGPWYGGSTGGLRGMKGRTWEGGVRVPMIARWSGRIPPGRTARAMAGIIDLFPTLVRLAGAEVADSPPLDGRDIWPLMMRDDAPSPHDALFMMAGPRVLAMRSGPWKLYIRSPGRDVRHPADRPWIDPRGPDGVTILAPYEQHSPEDYPGLVGDEAPEGVLLFNLETDRAEQVNLAPSHQDIVQRLTATFDSLASQVPAFDPPRATPLEAPGPRPALRDPAGR